MSQTKSRSLIVATCLLAVACHSESSTQATKESESNSPAASASAVSNDKLAKALASAITTENNQAPPGSSDTSPPSDGVIDSAKADAQAPKHAPPKLTLGAPGSEPRVLLSHKALSVPVKATLQVAVDLGGGQGLPPVDFKLDVKANTAKPDAKGIQEISARITDVSSSAPNVPADFTAQLKQLVGSKIAYRVSDQGGAFDFSQELGKSKKQELGDLLEMVLQGLAGANLATPSEPVGAGAYWMVVSRRPLLGLDWVVYDMVKVAKVADKEVALEISSRRYAVGREIQAPAGMQGPQLTIREANASETTQATALSQGSLLSHYEKNQAIKLLLDASDKSGQRMMQAGGQMKFQINRP